MLAYARVPREVLQKKFPFPRVPVPTFDEAKMKTLAYFAVTPGWHSVKQFLNDPLASEGESLVLGTRSVPMRLFRYTRQGLLRRRRGRRGYEYEIAMRGEERLLHLWRKNGLLDPQKGKIESERNALEVRLKVENVLLEKHARILDELKRKAFFQLAKRLKEE